ncbi:MAG: peptidase M16 [Flavobacteriales bacterium]|nr:MAG: peptidase M16 [Flavobacteriales bacterium]
MKYNFKYIAAAFLVSGMLSAQRIDINKMPTAGPTPTINIKKPQTFKLKNGLTVMVVENHKLPRVNVSLRMDRPPYYEGKIVGVSGILSEQLGNGTQNMSKDAFNERIDFLGARLSINSGGAYANSLSKYFPEVLGMMADAIKNPLFDAKEIEDAKKRTIEELKSSEKSAEAIAEKTRGALIYGKNTARGEFETIESIQRITPQDVKNIYQKYYAPNNAYLVIVGDVEFKKVKKLVKKNFKKWKKSTTKFAPLGPAHRNVAQTEINVVNVPNAVQSIIKVGNLHKVKKNNPQYFAATLGNYILGGGGEARLFLNLREKNAFTYGAYSSVSMSKYSPSFTAFASVRNEVTDKAVVEFMKELKGIENVTAEELKNAKAKQKGEFIRSLEQPSTIADFALSQKINNLPENFYTNYLKSVDNVSIADVKKAMKSVVLPNQSRIFIVGKATEIGNGLEKLGYPVKYFDKEANPIKKPVAKKAAVSIATVGEKYIQAIGGKSAVEKIQSMTVKAKATVQGMEMNMTNIIANGGKSMVDVQMMGQTMQKIVFDGKDGYISARGQKMPMPENMKQEMAKAKLVFPELSFGQSADYKVDGVEDYAGESCYVVVNGTTKMYYSVKTGLKVGDVKSAQGQTMPTTYANYKAVNGIKVPYTTNQKMGGMDIKMEVQSVEFNKAKDADFK